MFYKTSSSPSSKSLKLFIKNEKKSLGKKCSRPFSFSAWATRWLILSFTVPSIYGNPRRPMAKGQRENFLVHFRQLLRKCTCAVMNNIYIYNRQRGAACRASTSLCVGYVCLCVYVCVISVYRHTECTELIYTFTYIYSIGYIKNICIFILYTCRTYRFIIRDIRYICDSEQFCHIHLPRFTCTSVVSELFSICDATHYRTTLYYCRNLIDHRVPRNGLPSRARRPLTWRKAVLAGIA